MRNCYWRTHMNYIVSLARHLSSEMVRTHYECPTHRGMTDKQNFHQTIPRPRRASQIYTISDHSSFDNAKSNFLPHAYPATSLVRLT